MKTAEERIAYQKSIFGDKRYVIAQYIDAKMFGGGGDNCIKVDDVNFIPTECYFSELDLISRVSNDIKKAVIFEKKQTAIEECEKINSDCPHDLHYEVIEVK